MPIEFRSVNPESYEEVRQMMLTYEYSWRDSDPEGYIPVSEEDREKGIKHYIEAQKKQNVNDFAFAAFDGDQMVGSHLLEIWMIDGLRACHVHGLWVSESYRNQGIASRLKKLGEEWAVTRDCQMMDTNVRVTNKGMIALNEKLGYEVRRYNFRKSLAPEP